MVACCIEKTGLLAIYLNINRKSAIRSPSFLM